MVGEGMVGWDGNLDDSYLDKCLHKSRLLTLCEWIGRLPEFLGAYLATVAFFNYAPARQSKQNRESNARVHPLRTFFMFYVPFF